MSTVDNQDCDDVDEVLDIPDDVDEDVSGLDVDDPGELLDAVEQDVPLLDAGLVLPVLTVRPVGHHNTPNLIYLGVKSTAGNEPAQLGVHILLSHSKSISHVDKCQTAV